MNAIRTLAGKSDPESYALVSAMVLEHVGNLFTFLDQRLGELVMFDPEARVKEQVIREALKVGGLVTAMVAKDGKACGADPAVMRDLWTVLVEEAVRRSAGPTSPPQSDQPGA